MIGNWYTICFPDSLLHLKKLKTFACVTGIIHMSVTQFWLPYLSLKCPDILYGCHQGLLYLSSTAIIGQKLLLSSGLSTKLTPKIINIFQLRSGNSPCNLHFVVSSFPFCFPFHFLQSVSFETLEIWCSVMIAIKNEIQMGLWQEEIY